MPAPQGSQDPAPHPAFAVVEHTADWALRVVGSDFPALLRNAARGMNSLLVEDVGAVGREVAVQLALEAFDRESMLVEWLSELAYLAEMEGLIFGEFELQEAGPTVLRAVVRGGRAQALQKHIKAVTYHDLEVVETAAGLEATIVFDV